MKPRFYIVMTGATSRRFDTRAMARAYRAALKLSGVAAVVRPVL